MMKSTVKKCFVLVLAGSLPLLAGAHNGTDHSYQTNNNNNGYSSYSRDDFRESRSQTNPYGFSAHTRQPSAPYSRQSSVSNDVITVMSSPVGAHVKLGGSVISYKEVTLTAQLPGRVQYIAGEAGDHLKINSVLVALDDDDLLAKRRAAVAQLNNMAAGYRNSRIQYTKNVWNPGQKFQKYFVPPQAATGGGGGYFPQMFDRFFGMGGGGGGNNYYNNYYSNPWLYGNPWIERQADLYSSATGVSQAGSQVMAVQAQIDEVDARLLDTRSIAPFDGVILRKLVEVGDTVQPGTPLMTYADTTDLQIQVEVPARLMPGLQTGMIVPATLDVGDKEVNARISQIYPLADPQRHTVTVKLDLPKGVPGGPGMYAEVSFPDTSVPVSNLPVIPTSAIIWRGSLPAVYIVNGDNETELRLIRLGEQLDQYTVAVLSGIRIGERLYSNPPPGMNSNLSKQPAHKN